MWKDCFQPFLISIWHFWQMTQMSDKCLLCKYYVKSDIWKNSDNLSRLGPLPGMLAWGRVCFESIYTDLAVILSFPRSNPRSASISVERVFLIFRLVSPMSVIFASYFIVNVKISICEIEINVLKNLVKICDKEVLQWKGFGKVLGQCPFEHVNWSSLCDDVLQYIQQAPTFLDFEHSCLSIKFECQMLNVKCQMSYVNMAKLFVGAYLQSFCGHFLEGLS